MRRLTLTLFFIFFLGFPFVARAADLEVTAQLLVSNPAPYIGEEVDLLLEVTYNSHPGGRTSFSWPNLDNFISTDLTTIHSRRGRDEHNRLVETMVRRIKPLTNGTLLLRGSFVVIGNQRVELQPITLRVQPLPITGQPENFQDNIGTYQLNLAASGTGPREISLHIYDSNLLSTVPNVQQWLNSEEQLIPIDVTTRTARIGREHILRYFYETDAEEKEDLRFTLTVYDPLQHRYLEVETGPATKSASVSIFVIILSVFVFVAGGLVFRHLRRYPRTVAGCLQRVCRRTVQGLSREQIQALIQPHLNRDELEVLRLFWHLEDEDRFNLNSSTGKINSRLATKSLRKSLWKAIDKQQNIT